MSNNYLVKMQQEVAEELLVAKKQNQFFKDNELYPEYNMDDIIIALEEQLESLKSLFSLAGIDYDQLYDTQDSEIVVLTEDLSIEEKELQKKNIYMEMVMDDLTDTYKEYSNGVDELIGYVKNNRAEEMANEVMKAYDLTEEDIINSEDESNPNE